MFGLNTCLQISFLSILHISQCNDSSSYLTFYIFILMSLFVPPTVLNCTTTNFTIFSCTTPNFTIPNYAVPNFTTPNCTKSSCSTPNCTTPNFTTPSCTTPNCLIPTVPHPTVLHRCHEVLMIPYIEVRFHLRKSVYPLLDSFAFSLSSSNFQT